MDSAFCIASSATAAAAVLLLVTGLLREGKPPNGTSVASQTVIPVEAAVRQHARGFFGAANPRENSFAQRSVTLAVAHPIIGADAAVSLLVLHQGVDLSRVVLAPTEASFRWHLDIDGRRARVDAHLINAALCRPRRRCGQRVQSRHARRTLTKGGRSSAGFTLWFRPGLTSAWRLRRVERRCRMLGTTAEHLYCLDWSTRRAGISRFRRGDRSGRSCWGRSRAVNCRD